MVRMTIQEACNEYDKTINLLQSEVIKMKKENGQLKKDIDTVVSVVSDLNDNFLKLEKKLNKPVILNTKVGMEELS